ncbi:MAG TPA: LPS export ABC transporter ATP-binding protein [Spirochaetales bacterium]|nr:LPS export ABC transporter ATP-binding protein [Spirochaetales bacterium]
MSTVPPQPQSTSIAKRLRWRGTLRERYMVRATLQAENLKKKYGRKTVVKDVSLQMESGQIIGLLGPNGAGKTTMFYMIVGFIKADGGRILLNGRNVTTLPMYSRSRLGLSYLPQEPSIFRKLSVEDNLKLVIETRDDLTRGEKKESIEALIEEFGLQGVRKQYGYTLSGGERRRTEIARALASNPLFLLLDEPFAGIDPKAVYEIKKLIKSLAERGIGILLTDHNVRDTLEITHQSLIINEGEILASGKRSDLLQNEEARRIYFGDDFSNEGGLT